MDLDYKTFVLRLLENKKFGHLSDYVILSIHHKWLPAADCSGVQRSFSLLKNDPEVIFETENEPFRYVYLERENHYGLVFKTARFSTGPAQCINVKLRENHVNEALHLKLKTFEEQIYVFVSHLNFDVPRVRSFLGLGFVEATRFVPTYVKLWVSSCRVASIDNYCVSPRCFGPLESTTIEPRFVDGRLSPCRSKTRILSLRDHFAWEKEENHPEFVRNYHPYNIHYVPQFASYVPLAFNPLENPIICSEG